MAIDTSLVAGRTGAQIEAAKRKAVGGKRKRCTKGKSCSATCIAANKVCLVDIPWVAAQNLSKVRDSILKKSQENPGKSVKFPAKLAILPDDNADIKWLKEYYNSNRDTLVSDIKANKIKKDDIQKIIMTVEAKRKSTIEESNPTKLEILERRKAEGPAFEQLNKELLTKERLLREKVILAEMIRVQMKKMPRNTFEEKQAYNKMEKFFDETKSLNQYLFGSLKKTLADKEKLKARLSRSEGNKKSIAPKEPEGKSTSKFVLSAGKAPLLPKLTNEAEFKRISEETEYMKDKEAKDLHQRTADLLRSSNQQLTAFRNSIIKRIGGQRVFNAAMKGIEEFTEEQESNGYKDIRNIQRAIKEGKPVPSGKQQLAKYIDGMEKLIAKLPKEPVIKYRGVRVSDQNLAEILQAAKLKNTYQDGALASWSTSLGSARSFANMIDDGAPNRVIFRTVNRRGIPVDGVSSTVGENEMLTSGTAKYRHTGRVNKIEIDQYGTGNVKPYYVIDVVEM